jgi:hypothetical protein
MIVLEDKNLKNFRKMFDYIPEKTFPSVLLLIDVKHSRPIIKFSDIDINQSLVINVETELVNYDSNEIEKESFRLPLTKNVKTIINNFDKLILENNSIVGISKNKEVKLSMYVNESDEYDFPKTANEMLKFTKEMNQKDDIMEVNFDLDTETIKDLYSCMDVLDRDKSNDIILNMTLGKQAKSIVITAKDAIGNNFKYTIDDIKVDDTFKVKYDNYFLSILKVLKDTKEVTSFPCTLSNLMFGTSFEIDEVSIMLAVTVFEKLK